MGINDLSSSLSHTSNIDDFSVALNIFTPWIDSEWIITSPWLNGKNIADIWSGFSMFLSQLKPYVGEWKRVWIDPIYNYEKSDIYKIHARKRRRLRDSTITAFSRQHKMRVGHFLKLRQYSFSDLLHANANNIKKTRWWIAWKMEDDIEYKWSLDVEDQIDIAFCTSLFFKIPEPLNFLKDIILKLAEWWELILTEQYIRHDNRDKSMLFLDALFKNYLIDCIDETTLHGCSYRIKKEIFIKEYDQIEKLYYDFYGLPHRLLQTTKHILMQIGHILKL